MVTVEFLGPIKKNKLVLDITNLNQLSDILKKDVSLIKWLDNSAVAINDILVNSNNINLNDNDKITILPPVCGG
jgi:molybdopterin synthase sulfur carrier subunit